jgi:hypothetical protein
MSDEPASKASLRRRAVEELKEFLTLAGYL